MALFVGFLASCHAASTPSISTRESVDASPAPIGSAIPLRDAAVVIEGPAIVEQVALAKDAPASLVRGRDGAPPHIVFMPGLCSNAYAYLTTFPETARAHGGVVAVEGDEPCGDQKGFRSFSWNPALQKKRIEAALAAAGATAPSEGLTLVGYSSGASIAEMMHTRWPEIFARLVLIAPPTDPKVEHFAHARGVVAMSCSLDVPYRMKKTARDLGAAHVASLYLEMPKCTHGNIADGERVFGEAFDFLDAQGVD